MSGCQKNVMNSPPFHAAGDAPIGRVLVVDGQEMVRCLLCRILKSWGLACHPATNLMSAYRAALSEGPFDAVVCDYELPDGNADNLAALMREHGIMTPIVAPIGSLAPMTKHEPGVELLAKPFDPIDLKAVLERMLGVGLRKEADPAYNGYNGGFGTRMAAKAAAEPVVRRV
jgi:DNA-binding NtrC family response regulator